MVPSRPMSVLLRARRRARPPGYAYQGPLAGLRSRARPAAIQGPPGCDPGPARLRSRARPAAIQGPPARICVPSLAGAIASGWTAAGTAVGDLAGQLMRTRHIPGLKQAVAGPPPGALPLPKRDTHQWPAKGQARAVKVRREPDVPTRPGVPTARRPPDVPTRPGVPTAPTAAPRRPRRPPDALTSPQARRALMMS